MKRRASFLLVIVLLLTALGGTTAFADYAGPSPSTLKPYSLTAAEIQEDQTHPYGSATLTFKIDNLPGDTGDNTLTWYVGIEKRIGTGEWLEVELIPATTMLSTYATGGGSYRYEQLWTQDYQWDGSQPIGYRVQVVLDDITGNRGGRSDYSNVATLGLLSSGWATTELREAQANGLIPDILQGKDLTKPVTREEFCELAVLLYEEVSGQAAVPVSPNPFTDTTNPQILKAAKLEITNGVSATLFKPNDLITREQCAAMLFRTIRKIAPDGNYTVTSAKPFADQKFISGYALDAAKYMSLHGIIKGDAAGNFMPKATTTDQAAKGYGQATREAAIIMSNRTFKDMNGSSGTSGTSGPASSPAASASPATSSANPTGVSALVGTWNKDGASGSLVDPATGYATGSIYNGEWYVFRADGTFRYVIVSSGQVISGGIVWEGTYSVSGGTIRLTGIREAWHPNPAATGQKAAYSNLAMPDTSFTYTMSADGGILSLRGSLFSDNYTRV